MLYSTLIATAMLGLASAQSSTTATLTTATTITSTSSASSSSTVKPGSVFLGQPCNPNNPGECVYGSSCYAVNSMQIPTCGGFQASCSSNAQCATNFCVSGFCNGQPSTGAIPLGQPCSPNIAGVCANAADCYASNSGLIPVCGNFNANCRDNTQCAFNACLNGFCNGLVFSSTTTSATTRTSTSSGSRTTSTVTSTGNSTITTSSTRTGNSTTIRPTSITTTITSNGVTTTSVIVTTPTGTTTRPTTTPTVTAGAGKTVAFAVQALLTAVLAAAFML